MKFKDLSQSTRDAMKTFHAKQRAKSKVDISESNTPRARSADRGRSAARSRRPR